MGLVRKAQVAAGQEAIPGQAATLTGADVIDLLEADWSESRELIERNAASGTLSKGVEGVGPGDSTLNIIVDVKGSGTATTVPDWAVLMNSCLMEEVDTLTVDTSAAGITDPLEPGDILTGQTSGAEAIVLAHVDEAASALNIPAYMISGTFSTGETVDSRDKGVAVAVLAVTPTTANQGKAWKPVSEVQTSITTSGAWSASDPAVGEGVKIEDGGTIVGEALIISVSGTATVLEMVWGVIASGYALTSTTGQTATVTGTPSTTLAATVTARFNRDRLIRDLVEARGNPQLAADAGQPGRFTFAMQGSPQNPTDGGRFTAGLPTITTTPPRFAGGYFSIDGIRVVTKSVQWDGGNNVVQIADANSTDGRKGGAITEREPTLTVTIDQGTIAGLDLWSKWKAATTVTLGVQIGNTSGNRITIAASKAQITEITDSDNEGIAGFNVTFRLRQESAVGDNEYFVAHT